MKTRTSRVWKFIIALLPAAGIVAAQTRMDDDWFSSRTINTAGLIHYWNMEGSGANLAGSVTLTSTNGLTYADGLYGFQSASFNSQRWFKTSANVVLSNNFTVSFWARRLLGPHAGQATFGMPFGGTASQGYVNITTNEIRLFNDGETKSLLAPFVVPSNVWTHVAITCGSNIVTYANGALLAQSNYTAPFVVTMQMVGIGYTTAADNGQRYFWRGLLDDFRVYSRQLSSGEVFKIYSEPVP